MAPFFLEDNEMLNSVRHLLLGWFTLDLGVVAGGKRFCLSPGMTAVQELLSGYLLPLALILVFSIIWIGQLCWNRLQLLRLRSLLSSHRPVSINRFPASQSRDDVALHSPKPFHSSLAHSVLENNSYGYDSDEEHGDSYRKVSEEAVTAPDLEALEASITCCQLHPSFPATLTSLCLLLYGRLLATTLSLVNCVKVNDQWVLFGAASQVECYQHWQLFLVCFLVVVLAPFPLFVEFCRYRISLYRGGQSAASLSSLPSHSHGFGSGHVQSDAHGGSAPTLSMPVQAAIYMIEAPYSQECQWWEVVMLGRRLLLITLGTVLSDPFLRAFSLTLACFLVLLLHLYFHPFKYQQSQRAETGFLSALFLLSLLQLRRAMYASLGMDDEFAWQELVSSVFVWLQLGLITLPFAYCFLTVVHYYGPQLGKRLCRACGMCCFRCFTKK
eukprot:TRINITY_DN9833_c0_g1_i2.p1 TRINITY_DN9833_c0_g1~~TRINITY_DN9833_c0_g1_i2.p1  ORF type:complete len:474 (-),score=114.90 TRINITY_DN9833_c0_g1_i2:10-1332(-)